MKIPTKLVAMWYIFRGHGVIYRARIQGSAVVGNRRLLVAETNICPPDVEPIHLAAYPRAHLDWAPPTVPTYPQSSPA